MIGEIYEGMTVRGFDGSKLGKIEKIGDGTFTIEKGLLSKDRHEARFSDVKEIRNGEAIVDLGAGASAGDTSGMRTGETRTGATAGKGEELRVPLAEEQLEVAKTEREAGQVRVSKHVETEEKHISVPVRREEVSVERVAAEGRPATGEAFQDKSYTIPIHEEEVEVRKRPVVREEVRVSANSTEEERDVRDTVRREIADVDTEGSIRGAPRRDPNDRY